MESLICSHPLITARISYYILFTLSSPHNIQAHPGPVMIFPLLLVLASAFPTSNFPVLPFAYPHPHRHPGSGRCVCQTACRRPPRQSHLFCPTPWSTSAQFSSLPHPQPRNRECHGTVPLSGSRSSTPQPPRAPSSCPLVLAPAQI